MGAKDLLKFIAKTVKTAGVKKYSRSKFSGFSVAVDTSLMLHSVSAAVRSSGADLVNSQGQLTSHLSGLFYKTIKFLEGGITPIYVFDGKPLDLKSHAAVERKEKKKKAQAVLDKLAETESDENNYAERQQLFIKNFTQTFSLSDQDITEAKILLDLMGVPFIQAPEEADDVCAWLAARTDENDDPYVRGVCSNDSDMLPLGAPYLFFGMIGTDDEITVYSLKKILENMKLSMEQFVELATFCGTDYCERIPDLGPARAYKLILKYGSMEKIFESIRENEEYGFTSESEPATTQNPDIPISTCYETVKQRYMNALNKLDKSKTFVITDNNLRLKLCQKKELLDFMHTKHGFELPRIHKGIDRLNACHKVMGITRENNKPVHKILSKQISSLGEKFSYVSTVKILDSDSEDEVSEELDESSEEAPVIPSKATKSKSR
jgi:flap endonuclease-1